MTKYILVREALDADVDGIVSIYNDVLATTSAIWSDQPVSVPDRQRWLADIGRKKEFTAAIAGRPQRRQRHNPDLEIRLLETEICSRSSAG